VSEVSLGLEDDERRRRKRDSRGGEGSLDEVLEELDSEIGVGLGLDLVSDTGDWRKKEERGEKISVEVE